MKLNERIVNAIYGQCVADAVGNPFEFRTDINPDGVVEYVNSSPLLKISDDSQMAFYGFESIQNLSKYSSITLKKQVEYSFTDSYLDWFETQSCGPSQHEFYEDCLLSFKSMWSVQAPGMTCLESLESIKSGESVQNDSMGCGSVMRLLPLVLLFDKYNKETVFELAQITGAITHKHKSNDSAIRRYMDVAYQIVNNILVENIHTEVTHISQLGEGWIAPECVDMAVWAYLNANTFEELLSLSIAHDGDSDSVAAVAGSLWGLAGKEVPKKYVAKLDVLDAIDYVISNIE